MSIVEWIALASYVGVIITMILQTKINGGLRGEHVAWLIWAIHGAIFYLCLLGDYQDFTVNSLFFNDWSAILRLHGIFTVLLVSIFNILTLRLKAGKGYD